LLSLIVFAPQNSFLFSFPGYYLKERLQFWPRILLSLRLFNRLKLIKEGKPE